MGLRLAPIESKPIWEEFLLSHAPQSLFQSWLWGEVEKKAGHSVYRFGIFDRNTLVGIAQILVVRARRGTFFHIRHGPVWKEQKKTYWKEFIASLRLLAKKDGAWFIRVSPLIENSPKNHELMKSVHFVHSPTHEVDAERCWVLDLDKSDEELLMGMRKTTRYEIRQAQKSVVTVQRSTDSKDLAGFYQLYEETSRRHGFVAHSSITEEFEVFAREHKALLLLGYYQKELVAGAIVLFYGGQAIYHHGASKFSKVPASYLVQWEAIAEAKKRGIKVYNFYGIAPDDKPNHPWRGITLFKKGFGGRQINYLHAHDYPLSPLYVVSMFIETVRRLRRGY